MGPEIYTNILRSILLGRRNEATSWVVLPIVTILTFSGDSKDESAVRVIKEIHGSYQVRNTEALLRIREYCGRVPK